MCRLFEMSLALALSEQQHIETNVLERVDRVIAAARCDSSEERLDTYGEAMPDIFYLSNWDTV